jgi:two-component system, LytTR family, response regulator
MLRAVVIDDEKQSRNALISELDKYKDQIKIIGEADSVASAIEAINDFHPDIVFLDIHLGDGMGFNVLERISWTKFKVVFVTAYDEYAIKAFKFNAIDYILKPVSTEDISLLMGRLVRFEPMEENILNKNFLANYNNSNPKRIAISNSDGVHLVDIDDVIRCEADGNYTKIFTINGEVILTSKTLKEYDTLLLDFNFERVHNSHLVNMRHIKKYLNKDSGYLQMSDGSQIPVSQRKKSYVLSILDKIV